MLLTTLIVGLFGVGEASFLSHERTVTPPAKEQMCDYEHLDRSTPQDPNTDPNCHVYSSKFAVGYRAAAGTQLVLPDGDGFICRATGPWTSTVRFPGFPFDAMTPLGVSVACFLVVQQAVQAGSLTNLVGPVEGTAALPSVCNVTVTITAAYDKSLIGLSDICPYNPPTISLPSPLPLLVPESLSKTPVQPCTFAKIKKSGVTQVSYKITPGGVVNLPNLGLGAGNLGLCLDDLRYIGEKCHGEKCSTA